VPRLRRPSFLVALGVTTVVSLAIVGLSWARVRADPSSVAYLRQHRYPLPLEGRAPVTLPPAVRAARVIVLGEAHGIADIQRVDLALLSALRDEGAPLRYLAELDMNQAMLVNEYLETGNEASLTRLFVNWRATQAQWANLEFYGKLRAIRALNLARPDLPPVRVVGVDRMQDPQLAIDLLTSGLARVADDSWPDAVLLRALLADSASRVADAADAPLPRAAAAALATMPATAPREMSAAQWRDLRQTVSVLAQRHTATGRSAAIAENVFRVVEADSSARFYGLWGIFHAIQGSVNGVISWTGRLGARGAALDGKLATLVVIPVDSRMMLPSRALPTWFRDTGAYTDIPYSLDHPVLNYVAGAGDLQAAADTLTSVLFDISGSDSPPHLIERLLDVRGILTALQKFDIDSATASGGKLVQAVVLIRGSRATTPWMPAPEAR
jgi:hypothetical protein